tara:strand:+ start:8811 stop:10865 length:2055 start_codon:yes stop_codon:yes gene_type:complete
MPLSKWKDPELSVVYKLRVKENKTFNEIGAILGRTGGSVERKFKRTNWDKFNNISTEEETTGEWSQGEMGQLCAFIEMDLSYKEIADKIGRGYISVERKAQKTDWKAWKVATGEMGDSVPETEVEEIILTNQLVDALVLLSRRDDERLKNINEKHFRQKINFAGDKFPVTFTEIKRKAKAKFGEMGLENPEEEALGEGTYIVVGDSHGKFTKTAMFDLLKQVSKHVKAKQIFHIGHILDDDNDISYNWGQFKNLTVLAKTEELHQIQEQRNKFDFKFEIVRGMVGLGKDLCVMNQDLITDYVKTPISSLDSEIFDDKVIVNCHRQEFIPKTNYDGHSYFASPGSLCERHIIKTIKQIDFERDRTVKVAYHTGFSKYRRMKHLYKYWQQGIAIVNVDAAGDHTIILCKIEKINGEYVTSYLDNIITNKGIKKPDEKIFMVFDTHCPYHDPKALDIAEQICKRYKPDKVVHGGDAHDYKPLNHHEMDRGHKSSENILTHSAATHLVLKKIREWAPLAYIIYGNHERFGKDFTAKFPQLEELLDFQFICDVEGLGYDITNLQDVLELGSLKVIHGELRTYGQGGTPHEKFSRTFGNDIAFGHVHYPGLRFGAVSAGLMALLDQGYNEKNASRWLHGFVECNQYKGISFMSTIAISDYKCILDKVYTPDKPEEWELSNYKAKIVYDVN